MKKRNNFATLLPQTLSRSQGTCSGRT